MLGSPSASNQSWSYFIIHFTLNTWNVRYQGREHSEGARFLVTGYGGIIYNNRRGLQRACNRDLAQHGQSRFS